MLTLTEDARIAIRELVAPTETADGAGVRIAASDDLDGRGPELALSVVGEPAPGDEVVDDEGARVFLDPAAARMLDEETLDVQVDPTARQVNFFVK